ncbi:MAG: DUF1700 domain-containing protein [Ruminococcaceae bacterium]|nr:DUF1700 domain-containing protein [Oscillospiraceae bacterium]
MTKTEFFDELKIRLSSLPEEDIKSSLDYYSEMIDDRIEDGLSEEDAIKDIGTPADIASEILREMPLSKLVAARVKPKRRLAAWEIVLLALGSPIWVSLLAAAFVVVLAVYIVIWSVVVSLYAVGISLAVAAFACIVYGFARIALGEVATILVFIGLGIFAAGLALFMFLACKYTTVGIIKLSKLIFRGIKSLFIRRNA